MQPALRGWRATRKGEVAECGKSAPGLIPGAASRYAESSLSGVMGYSRTRLPVAL